MEQKNRNGWKAILPYIIIPLLFVISIVAYSQIGQQSAQKKQQYYEVVELFKENKISEYNLNLSNGNLRYKIFGDDKVVYEYAVPSVQMFVNDIHSYVMKHNEEHKDTVIKANYKSGAANSWWVSLLPTLAIMVVMALLMFIMFRRMSNSVMNENNRSMGFGKARIKNNADSKKKITFADVAGADEEKAELEEIVEFLKDPEKFKTLGARIPKGVLLVGPPGTGKTLLGKAVSGEAGVPFLSISGSDFVEMFVGVGASRVRDLFEKAKKNSPAIVFIDEIDAVGRQRGAGLGGGNDEREQTLNQLLVEMDGFEENGGVIVMAATNRPDVLDPALLRPGRFDRQVMVNLPDVDGREAILKIHAKNKPLAPDVNLRGIANDTVGFSGADIENLMNEAALLAAKHGKKAIKMADIEEATMKVVVGPEKKSRKVSNRDKKITAYHEAGHAVSSFYLENQDPVTQISIVPRGMAGGYTLYRPEKDEIHLMRSRMYDDIVSLLGGRVAETLTFDGDFSTGASNDIERATKMARAMITKYGMSDELGPINFGSSNDEVFIGRDFNHVRDYSEEIARKIDEEVEKIIKKAYKRCKDILTEHSDQLGKVAELLVKKEKISGEIFYAIMNGKYEAELDEFEIEKTEALPKDDNQNIENK
ncbi:MAG: ATP-dependent zinc metalloprotease FtsH [Candidatus Fimenecus sp.]